MQLPWQSPLFVFLAYATGGLLFFLPDFLVLLRHPRGGADVVTVNAFLMLLFPFGLFIRPVLWLSVGLWICAFAWAAFAPRTN